MQEVGGMHDISDWIVSICSFFRFQVSSVVEDIRLKLAAHERSLMDLDHSRRLIQRLNIHVAFTLLFYTTCILERPTYGFYMIYCDGSLDQNGADYAAIVRIWESKFTTSLAR